MKNIKMLKSCFIGSALFHEGLIFSKRIIPPARLLLWEKLTLVENTNQSISRWASEKVKKALLADKKALTNRKQKKADAEKCEYCGNTGRFHHRGGYKICVGCGSSSQ